MEFIQKYKIINGMDEGDIDMGTGRILRQGGRNLREQGLQHIKKRFKNIL
jgi:hypothetical protein